MDLPFQHFFYCDSLVKGRSDCFRELSMAQMEGHAVMLHENMAMADTLARQQSLTPRGNMEEPELYRSSGVRRAAFDQLFRELGLCESLVTMQAEENAALSTKMAVVEEKNRAMATEIAHLRSLQHPHDMAYTELHPSPVPRKDANPDLAPARRLTTALTTGSIHDAANLWFTNQSSAEAMYGAIAVWDTAAVTSLARLFCGLDSSEFCTLGIWPQ